VEMLLVRGGVWWAALVSGGGVGGACQSCPSTCVSTQRRVRFTIQIHGMQQLLGSLTDWLEVQGGCARCWEGGGGWRVLLGAQ
jgi:hypothetical protein